MLGCPYSHQARLVIERAGAGMAQVWRGRRYGAGAGMARAQVWRRNRKEKDRRRRDKRVFFLEDLDALWAEYRSFQRFPSSDFQTPTAQLARPSAERQALAGRLLYM